MSKNTSRGRIIAAAILIICAVVILSLAIRFVHHRMAYAVTDAVFVRTDSLVSVGFNIVSGRVKSINKTAGDQVRKGEILARLDNTPYRLTVERLKARLAAVKNERRTKKLFLRRLREETDLNQKIAASRLTELKKREKAMTAQIAAAGVKIEQLRRDNSRYKKLLPRQAVSHSQAEDAATRLRAGELDRDALRQQKAAIGASVLTSQYQLELAAVEKQRLRETAKEIKGLGDKIEETEAALKNARHNLAQCVLRSPLNGRVAKRFVSPGALVSPQKVVFSLINPKDIYLTVLLEEQKLAGVVPGSAVNITIDAYPDAKYEGVVETIMPASAATFALAPRDISAGEFTKVAQRIPVRIRITRGDIARLRVGMGGEVEIKRQKKVADEAKNSS
ncbi:Membrane fusion component of MSF-type tripartite multidrug efflux system [hydrothermal vent metagenome]|uniref:Membrane fusion component of MSF-type tripartite multidrug efflux system n=1 Tax=hydrothermal vent metagenome TaxID=652676 RepID=A0A3B0V678_9ZZZZ